MRLKLSNRISEGYLVEVSRRDLVRKSRSQSRSRFRRRLHYEVSNFRGVDLEQLFFNDYFIFTTPINDYEVTVAFPGVLTQLKKTVKSTYGDISKVNLQMVIKAMAIAFDKTDDVKVNCTCPDFRYRFAYWATQNGYKFGTPENRPSKITNPDDKLGGTCKHLSLLLSNKRWTRKAASSVLALIKAYPEESKIYLYDYEDWYKEYTGEDSEYEEDDEGKLVKRNRGKNETEVEETPEDEVVETETTESET